MAERPHPIEVTQPVTITVDGTDVEVQKGDLLIDACERNGVYIPRFCYHPRMSPVGMCRMCLVEVDTGRGPALQPSCMLECGDGMKVETETPKVKKAPEGVLEFLLLNHPLDCPVCDKGGECPLQDQTMSHGPGESRFIEEKRHYAKPIPINDNVLLDRERCILCDRCTRFASEVAGDPLIHFIDRGAATQVNTFPDHPFASYFSGNTVQVCPVGALTAKPYRFKARPWDLVETGSTCTGCSVGCRITVQSSRNEVLRYIGVDADGVNRGWLCDKGRFGFEAVNHADRLEVPFVRQGGNLVPARWIDALDAAADALRKADPSKVAVIGGARLTNESAAAWAHLAHRVVGTPHVDAQLDDGLPASVLGLPRATIDEACAPGGTVVVLAGDLKEELPVLFLRLKLAAEQHQVRIVEITPTLTGLSPYAAATLCHRPGEAPAVVDAVLGAAPTAAVAGVPADQLAAAAALLAGDGPLTVVLGRPSLGEQAGPTVDAAAAIAATRPAAKFLPALRRANVIGALTSGLRPGDGGNDTGATLAAAAEGQVEVLILLGADPVSDAPDAALAERALVRTPTVIAVDQFLNASSRQAHIVLAAAGFAEVDGTTTNVEGRVSPVRARVTPAGTSRPDWMIAHELAARLGSPVDVVDPAALTAELYGAEVVASLEEDAWGDGVLIPVVPQPAWEPPAAPTDLGGTDAYSLRVVISRKLYDQGTLVQHCPNSAGLAEAATARVGTDDASKLGVTDGAVVRLSAHGRSIALPAVVDAGVPKGTIVVPTAHDGADPRALVDASRVVVEARVEVDG